MIWQVIFSILGDTDKTGAPRNTRIPEEIYKHATMWKTETSFFKYYVHMCSIVKVQVYARE